MTHGRPKRPADLARHRAVVFAEPRPLDGIGLGVGPTFVVEDDLSAGRLERILPEWRFAPAFRLWVAHPNRRFVSAKVRAFLELVTRSLARTP